MDIIEFVGGAGMWLILAIMVIIVVIYKKVRNRK